jgi:PTH1 family peptidyl-tRNA hydrolase
MSDPTNTWLVAGLGNPGEKYASTFHNLGFRVANKLKNELCPEGTRWEALVKGRLVKVSLDDSRVVLIKPQTYMNLSGESVRPAADRFGVPVERIIVVHDDMDLDPGDVRVKVGGGTGGHKGLASLIQHLGAPGFTRVRLGIGRHPHMPSEKWVLSKIHADQEEIFDEAVRLAVEAVRLVIAQGPQLAMNETNRRGNRDEDEG